MALDSTSATGAESESRVHSRTRPLKRRSRSLKNLLQIPLLSHPGIGEASSTTALSEYAVSTTPNVSLLADGTSSVPLPSDMFLEIAEWLWKDDLLSLSLSVRLLRHRITFLSISCIIYASAPFSVLAFHPTSYLHVFHFLSFHSICPPHLHSP